MQSLRVLDMENSAEVEADLSTINPHRAGPGACEAAPGGPLRLGTSGTILKGARGLSRSLFGSSRSSPVGPHRQVL